LTGVVTQTRYTLPDQQFRFHFGSTYPEINRSIWGAYQCPPRPQQVTTSFRGDRGGRDISTDHLVFYTPWNSRYDKGHEFHTLKREISIPPSRTYSAPNPLWFYEGSLFPSWNIVSDRVGGVFDAPEFLDWESQGTLAISRTRPTNPAANLSTMLAEVMRDGLPRLAGQTALASRGSMPAKAGSEYLNAEFGWKPLISDVQKLARAVADSEAILKQFERDSGRNVRRRLTLGDERTVTTSYDRLGAGLNWLACPPNLWTDWLKIFQSRGTQRRLSITQELHETTWFSGCYTYHLSHGSDLMSRMERYTQQARHLLGLELDPSTLWDLAPWSWLVDWFGDIGVSLDNSVALSQDGLVLRYGYIMRTSVLTTTATMSGVRLVNGESLPPLSLVVRSTRKTRKRATPYGFGLSLSSLTGRQWSILSALGMTKADRVAW
jgi:hypothetical protein